MKLIIVGWGFFLLCVGGVLYMVEHHPFLFKEGVMWFGCTAFVGCFVSAFRQAWKKDPH